MHNMMVFVGPHAFRCQAPDERHAIQPLLDRGYKGEFLVSVWEGPYSRWRANDDGSLDELPSEKMLEDYLATHPEALRALSVSALEGSPLTDDARRLAEIATSIPPRR
jgi:hypothetical protein